MQPLEAVLNLVLTGTEDSTLDRSTPGNFHLIGGDRADEAATQALATSLDRPIELIKEVPGSHMIPVAVGRIPGHETVYDRHMTTGASTRDTARDVVSAIAQNGYSGIRTF